MTRCLASLRRVRLGAVPRVQWYYQDTMTSCRPISRHFVAFVRRYHGIALVLSLSRGKCHHVSLELMTRYLHPGLYPWKRQELPSSWATPIIRLLMLFDSGETVRSRPDFRATAWPPLRERQRLSQRELSRSSITWLPDSLSTLRHARYLTQRKTCFRPLVKRYRTGFRPAGSQSKVSNSHHVNRPPPPSILAQSPLVLPTPKTSEFLLPNGASAIVAPSLVN